MREILFISSSLKENSLGRLITWELFSWATNAFLQFKFDLLDLSSVDVPRCVGECVDESNPTSPLDKRLRSAAALIVTFPVYGQSYPGILKDLLDNSHLPGKPIFLIETLETPRSFLAFESLTNYFIFGHSSLVFPKFLSYTKDDLTDGHIANKMLVRSTSTLTRFINFVYLIKDHPIFHESYSHTSSSKIS